MLDQNTVGALEKLRGADLIDTGDVDILLSAAHLYHSLTQIMRLCQEGRFDPEKAPPGLKALLSQAATVPEFAHIAPTLEETQRAVVACFVKLIR